VGAVIRALAIALSAALALVLLAVTGALYTDSASLGANAFTTDTLDAPTGVTASPGGAPGTIDISWTATADIYATGHRVFRATASGGPYSQVGEVTPRTTTTVQDPGLTSGNTYYYVVKAYYQSWESVNSGETSATAP
jgi:hypothetical protein